MTAALLCFSLCTRAVLNLLWLGETENIKKPFSPSSLWSFAHIEPHVNPMSSTWACMLSCKWQLVCLCVCLPRVLWSEAEGKRRGQSIYIPEQSLMFCRSLAFPQIRFLLNDGVESDGIFEVFSQSVFLRGNGRNSRFGFEMADMSCTNTYSTNTHSYTHAGGTIKLRYVKWVRCMIYICSAVKSDRLSEGLWKLKNVCFRARGLQFELKGWS